MKYAQVYIDTNTVAIDQIFDYIVPEKFEDVIAPAMRVIVPFGKGNKSRQAFVVRLAEKTQYDHHKLKEIKEMIDLEPIIPYYLVETAMFLRDNYFCTYAEAIRTVLPSMDRIVRKITYQLCNETDSALSEQESMIYKLFKNKGSVSTTYIRNKTALSSESINKIISSFLGRKIIDSDVEFITQGKEQFDEFVILSDKDATFDDYMAIIGSRAKKQLAIIKHMLIAKEPILKKDLLQAVNTSAQVLNKLLDYGLIRIDYRSKASEVIPDQAFKEDIRANDAQKKVFKVFQNHLDEKSKKYLLFGVTGSGKTYVYFNMFKEILKKGKQCLLLVPEIALTPQMMDLVTSHFHEHVAIMHSKLTASERYYEFLKIKKGDAKIVLGARSALFMPFDDLGMIVIDEEHETSYKSSQSPRYDTVEVANHISDLTGCSLVLSSATPSIETYYKGLNGIYEILRLPDRVNNAPMPTVSIIDMRDELYHGNRSPISRILQDKIEERLANEEQIVLFLNRRGYNTYVFCRDCGYIEKCPHCEVSLTYHNNSSTMICHYCGFKKEVPTVCPDCGSKRIKYMGTGTQKIQEYVQQIFPEARVLRLDSDIARSKGSYERILNQFANKEADILIGTQMVVKGLDFEKVTLVGILLADAALNFPDINAASRTFQLTAQAAGRAGRRDLEGEVILQTYQPKDPTLVYASMHDYEGFYRHDIAHRKKMCYPPFTEIIGIFTANKDADVCIQDINKIYQEIKNLAHESGFKDIKFYEPAPAFIQKLKNKYIYHMLIRYDKDSTFKSIVREEYNQMKMSVESNVFVEINPITLL